MKKLFYIIPLIALCFACKKENATTEEPTIVPIAGKSNIVFFVDTFRVYTTDLLGASKKLILDEDVKSGNNYIMNIDYTTSKKLIYAYKPETNIKQEIRIVNVDGTTKKTIKTLANTTTSFDFLGSFGGKILYTTLDYSTPGLVGLDIRLMDEDGTNDKKVVWPKPSIAAKGGTGYLSITTDYTTAIPSSSFYKTAIANGTFDELKSFTIPKITGLIKAMAISDDANVFIYMLATDNTNLKYDVIALDISKKDGASKKIMTYEVPKTGDGAVAFSPQISMKFANGISNVIFSYGVNNSNGRYANQTDYYYFQTIDLEKATITNKWKIFNEYGGSLLVD